MNGNNQESPPAGHQDDRDEFNSALAELLSDNEAPANAAGADQKQATAPQEPEPSSSAAHADDQQSAAGNVAPEDAPSDDIWSGASEQQRQEMEKAKATISALKGRASASDRRLNELLQQVTQQSQGSQAPGNEQDNGTKSVDPLKTEAMDKIREEYPEVVGPIVDAMEAIVRQQDQLRAPVAAFAANNAETDLRNRVETYGQAHPDWQQWAHDPRWPDWLESQPRAIREAHARNLNVEDPHEAAWVLGEFKKWGGSPLAPDGSPIQQGASMGSDPQHATSSDASQRLLHAKRQRQLDAGRDGGSSGSKGGGSGIPDDFNAAMVIAAQESDRKHLPSTRM